MSSTLQRAIHELRIGHDLLKTASHLIEKDLGGYPEDLSNREKSQLIVALKNNISRRNCSYA